MSAIGRIFLVLNLIFATFFLGWASTSLGKSADLTKLLRDEQSAHETTKKDLTAKNSELTTQMNQLKTENGELRDARDQAKALADRNKEDLDAAKRAGDQMRGDLASIKEALNGYNTTIASLEKAKDSAVKEARDAEKDRDAARADKDKSDTAKRDAEDKLRGATAKVADLEVALTASKKQASALDTEIQGIVATHNISRKGATTPLVEGSVVQVDYSISPGLVAINKGKNAGVQRGNIFEIYNGSTYKGQVRVETVRDDMCSAVVITPVKGTTIAQGDRASTQI
jgi:predicted RNase H-like nuclease (RuvC/YqgF family)